jgi:thiol-disulfide isomerase/thioredoxin
VLVVLRLLALSALGAVGVLIGTADAQPAKPAEVTVTEVRAPELEKALQSYKGKVVLIDCWATWCVPCVKGFPHLVERHKKYADKGLVCVSLSLDKAGDLDEYKQEDVLKFLKAKGAIFPNFIVAEPRKDEEALLKLIGDSQAIPYMVMFDRNGKKVWASDEKPKLKEEQIDALLEQELAKKAG